MKRAQLCLVNYDGVIFRTSGVEAILLASVLFECAKSGHPPAPGAVAAGTTDLAAERSSSSSADDLFYHHFFSPPPLRPPPAATAAVAISGGTSLTRRVRERWRIPLQKKYYEVDSRREPDDESARLTTDGGSADWPSPDPQDRTGTILPAQLEPDWRNFTSPPDLPPNGARRALLMPRIHDSPARGKSANAGAAYRVDWTRSESDATVRIPSEPRSPSWLRTPPALLEFSTWRPMASGEVPETLTAKYFDAFETPGSSTTTPPPRVLSTSAAETSEEPKTRKIISVRRNLPSTHRACTEGESNRGYRIISAEVELGHESPSTDDDELIGRVERPVLSASSPRRVAPHSRRTRTSHRNAEWRVIKEFTSSARRSRSVAYTPRGSAPSDVNPAGTQSLGRAGGGSSLAGADRVTSIVPNDRVRFFEYYDVQTGAGGWMQDGDDEPYRELRVPPTPMPTAIIKQPSRTAKTISVDARRHATEGASSTSDDTGVSSKPVHWFDYPYMALYIFEPAEVYCDAAAISARWLVTSASCLSRRLAAPSEEAAYVVYCGVCWDRSEWINYVETEALHPGFATAHRAEYNLGAVKVASSMEACEGWRPVGLWHHRPDASPAATVGAEAVGWGLNRAADPAAEAVGTSAAAADERARDVNRSAALLTAALTTVYFGECPDRVFDRKRPATELGAAAAAAAAETATYCVTAASCGGVLVSGGRLLALWLEERPAGGGGGGGGGAVRYSPVWRACAWLRDAAREPLL